MEQDKDVNIKFTGVRPGKKLFEELLTTEEGAASTKHKRIFVAKPCLVEAAELERGLSTLRANPGFIEGNDVFEALASVLLHFKSYRDKVEAV